MQARISTPRNNWLQGIACPQLPTGATDEEGEPVFIEALYFGNGADEFPATDQVAASGRVYTERNFDVLQLDYLSAQNFVTVTQINEGFDGAEYPFPEEGV